MIVTRDSKKLVYNIACSQREIKALVRVMEFIRGICASEQHVTQFLDDFISEVRLLIGPNSGKGE